VHLRRRRILVHELASIRLSQPIKEEESIHVEAHEYKQVNESPQQAIQCAQRLELGQAKDAPIPSDQPADAQ